MALGQFDHTVKGWKNWVSKALDGIGIVSLVSKFTGNDFITGEKYKQSEKDAATLNIVFSIVGFATLGIGKGGQISGKAIMIYIGGEMTANVTIKATTEFMDEMGAPKWLQDITGLAAGVFVSNKVQGYMKTGVRTLDDITDMGLKNIDDIKKFGIGNIDDLKNIGIRDIDDLLKAGVRNPEDLLKLGVKNLNDLAELGITSLDDLSRIGIKNADDLTRLGIKNADEVFNGLKGASGAVDDIPKRPSWQQSEVDAGDMFPGYDSQKSYLNGKEVPYGTKDSSRPEYYTNGHSVEVKNYKKAVVV